MFLDDDELEDEREKELDEDADEEYSEIEEEDETLEELDVDDRGHVRPRRRRQDEGDDFEPEY
jgi:hypothetical protein